MADPGSGPRSKKEYRSLRTPHQNVPLKVDDRQRNRRASRSFVFADQSDYETPRSNIQMFMNATDTVQRIQSSASRLLPTAKRRNSEVLSGDDSMRFKLPRMRELIAESGRKKPRISSPGANFTPRTNLINFLQSGDENTPLQRTVTLDLDTPRHSTSSEYIEGQRVSVSPIREQSRRSENVMPRSLQKGQTRSARKSFQLNKTGGTAGDSLAALPDFDQRVSVSPLPDLDSTRLEKSNRDGLMSRKSAARKSFHLDAPNTNAEEEDSRAEQSEEGESGDNNDIGRDRISSGSKVGAHHETDGPDRNYDIEQVAARPSAISTHASANTADPASVYDLNITDYGDTSARQVTPGSKRRQSSGGSSRKKKTPGSAGRQRLSAVRGSTRRHLSYSEWKARENGQVTPVSPLQGRAERLSPRSSTPLNRTLRFLHSTKIQRSVTDFTQGDDELQELMSPGVKNLFPDVSPINKSVVTRSGGKALQGLSVSEDIETARNRQLSASFQPTEATFSKEVLLEPREATNTREVLTPGSVRSRQLSVSQPREVTNLTSLQPREVTNTREVLTPGSIRNGQLSASQPREATKTMEVLTPRSIRSGQLSANLHEFDDMEEEEVPGVDNDNEEGSGDSGEDDDQNIAGNRQTQNDERKDESIRYRDQRTSRKDTTAQEADDDNMVDSGSSLFSPLPTPHIDMRKRVQPSSVYRHGLVASTSSGRNQGKLNGPPKATKSRQKRAAPATVLPRSSVKYFAELYSDMKLSKDAIDEIEKASEIFWKNSFEAIEKFASHAGRKVAKDEDVILFMKTTRAITGTEDLHNKIRQMLPMDLRRDLIPCSYISTKKKK